MKITAISPIKYNKEFTTQNNKSIKKQHATSDSLYNPTYYTDYNVSINFGKRSPQDFYAQDFNKRNMPDTMKRYLYADFAQRSRIAPVQIMQEAFDNLSVASTVEDIKELFPDEPKFSKLRPANYKNATNGIMKKIKDIKAMQDEPEPLFKDGSDDLTTYLVKKIYLEGKTVKEIDKDFARDINPIYELAAKIPDETKKALGKNESAYFSHSTVYGLGIRFPEVPFWNSFIATRDDYERVKRVKSLTGEFVNADSAEGKAVIARRQAQTTASPKPRKYNFKRHNIKQISDAIVNSKGETRKVLKNANQGGRNTEELTFLQQYWSQIMSVATEKVHLSDEMIDFNATRKTQQLKLDEKTVDKLINGIDFSEREKTPFQIFWNERTDLKKHFSNAITDTVLLFTDAYGADGNNDEFKALLKYAQGIKPEREFRKLEHERIQAEYDEMAKNLQLLEEKPVTNTPAIEIPKITEEIKPQQFKYEIDGHEIIVPFDLKTQAIQNCKNDLIMIPNKTFDIYIKELDEIIKDNRERYYLSCCFDQAEDTPAINKVLYSAQEMREINDKLVDVMELKHNSYLEGTRFALFEYAQQKGCLTPAFIRRNINQDILAVRNYIQDMAVKDGGTEDAHREIQTIFQKIMKPLSNKEKIQARMDVFNYLKTYDMSNAIRPTSSVPRIIKLISHGLELIPSYADDIKACLSSEKILNEEGPILRYLLDKNADSTIKNMIREQTLQHILRFFPETVAVIATSNTEEYTKLLQNFPEVAQGLKILAQNTLAQQMFKLK